MDQSTILSKTLWSYRESGEYMDHVTLAYRDKTISAHLAMVAPLFSFFDISFCCIGNVPDVLILAELRSTQATRALKSLYTEQTIHPFQITLNDNKEDVEIEEDNDNEEEDKSYSSFSSMHVQDQCKSQIKHMMNNGPICKFTWETHFHCQVLIFPSLPVHGVYMVW